jgi:hypothetical protein
MGTEISQIVSIAILRKGDAKMKILQVVPTTGNASKLKTLLKKKELSLRGKGTTFYREREGRWKHERYPGWIKWDQSIGGFLVAEVNTKKEGSEWQLLQAFIGYLDRHLGGYIESISIFYR